MRRGAQTEISAIEEIFVSRNLCWIFEEAPIGLAKFPERKVLRPEPLERVTILRLSMSGSVSRMIWASPGSVFQTHFKVIAQAAFSQFWGDEAEGNLATAGFKASGRRSSFLRLVLWPSAHEARKDATYPDPAGQRIRVCKSRRICPGAGIADGICTKSLVQFARFRVRCEFLASVRSQSSTSGNVSESCIRCWLLPRGGIGPAGRRRRRLWLRHNVCMSCDFLKAALLSNPNCSETEMLRFSGIWHFPAPYNGFTPGHNHCFVVNPNILNLSFIRSDDEEPGLTIPKTRRLVTNLFKGLITTKSSDHVQRLRIVFQRRSDLFGIQVSNILLRTIFRHRIFALQENYECAWVGRVIPSRTQCRSGNSLGGCNSICPET